MKLLQKLKNEIVVISVVAIFLTLHILPTFAASYSVTNVTTTATPSTFTGICPTIITFTGSITANKKGIVTYQWERSDGSKSPVDSITFERAGTKTVQETWDIGMAGMTYSGWEKLVILSPNAIASKQADFTLTCDSFTVTSVSAIVSPSEYTGECPVRYYFTGQISTNMAGEVSYQWERSDGSLGPVQSVMFDNAGTKTVQETWDIGMAEMTYTGWQKLHVFSPNEIQSNEASFTLSCN